MLGWMTIERYIPSLIFFVSILESCCILEKIASLCACDAVVVVDELGI